MLTFLNKTFTTKKMIRVRNTRFEKNFESLIERDNDFQIKNHSISSRIVIRSHDKIVYNFSDDDFSDDNFSDNFVEYLSCVFRINRDEFLIMIQSYDDFEHLNKFDRSKMIQMMLKL